MFRQAMQKIGESLKGTLDLLEFEVKTKIDHVVMLVENDYKALLTSGSIFKALSAARDELRDLLADVDRRFETALRTVSQPATCKDPEQTEAAMDICDGDDEAPGARVADGSEKPVVCDRENESGAARAAEGDERPAGDSENPAAVRIKTEFSHDTEAINNDVPMQGQTSATTVTHEDVSMGTI